MKPCPLVLFMVKCCGRAAQVGDLLTSTFFFRSVSFPARTMRFKSDLQMVRNDNYWGKKPYFEHVLFHLNENPEQAI
jgi:hypothetical protein